MARALSPSVAVAARGEQDDGGSHSTFIVKKGRMGEAVKLLRELGAQYPPVHGRRVYTLFGSFDQLITEDEYESLEEYQQRWGSFRESAEFRAFHKRWFELTEAGGTHEMWRLE